MIKKGTFKIQRSSIVILVINQNNFSFQWRSTFQKSKNPKIFGFSALCPNWLKIVSNGANHCILSWFTRKSLPKHWTKRHDHNQNLLENWVSKQRFFCFDIDNGLKKVFFSNKTFLFFKIESWNFQVQFEIEFHETLQNFNSIWQPIKKRWK